MGGCVLEQHIVGDSREQREWCVTIPAAAAARARTLCELVVEGKAFRVGLIGAVGQTDGRRFILLLRLALLWSLKHRALHAKGQHALFAGDGCVEGRQ